MAAPVTGDDFLDHLRVSALLKEDRIQQYLEELQRKNDLPTEPKFLAARFVRDGLLTSFQAQQLLQGRHRNFIVGKYKLLQPLGVGGMSKVFLCEHLDMGHRVAMKVMSQRRGTDEATLARFFREARIIASLNHPNIVRAHDIDSSEGRIHYIIMDYIEGVALDALVRKRGRLAPEHAAHYVAQAACGLGHIHEAGLIHRDVKPGNLLVDREGVIKILDLGLARLQADEDRITAKFDGGSILGTADFIAPEQSVLGMEVDHRVDIYGLGATFYFLLTGRVPFEASNVAEKLMCHRLHEPQPITAQAPDTPPAIEAIVKRMMAKRPEDRYQTAAEVLKALAPWLEINVPPPTTDELPKLCRASLGSSPQGLRRPVNNNYLAAAKATLFDTGDTVLLPTADKPASVPYGPKRWLFLVAAVAIAATAAGITWLLR